MPNFLIRADASASIGTGHMMRCLALAGELKKFGGTVIFVAAECPEAIVERAIKEGCEVVHVPQGVQTGSASDAEHFASLADSYNAQTIIIDGYHFLTDYQKAVHKTGRPLLYIDDLSHCSTYDVDYILNQNAGAEPAQYQKSAPAARLLLGPGYVLLRSDFRKLSQTLAHSAYPRQARNILVTMGGGDIDNVTATIMKSLAEVPAAFALKVTLVVGSANPHAESISELAILLSANTAHAFTSLFDVKNMAEKLSQSDLVISAGGTTVWEAACLARPTAVIITADNQKAGMQAFAAQGAVRLLGETAGLNPESLSNDLTDLILSEESRRAMAHRAASLIDGEGASRVVDSIWPDK